jgi:topoisomerase-4 subunit A
MRLRALRKLEEVEIKKEHAALAKEKAELEGLLRSAPRQKTALGKELAALDETYGGKTPLGRRRTEIGSAPEPVEVPPDALIEREPITVILSEKGWVRALKGQVAMASASGCTPRPPTSSCCSPAMAGSTRSRATSCRAAVASASPFG